MFLSFEKTYCTRELTFLVSLTNSFFDVGLVSSAVSVGLTLDRRLVFQVQEGKPSHSNSLKRSTWFVISVSFTEIIFSSLFVLSTKASFSRLSRFSSPKRSSLVEVPSISSFFFLEVISLSRSNCSSSLKKSALVMVN